MTINYVVQSVVLSLVLLGSAAGKPTRRKSIVTSMRGVGVAESWLPRLALLEIAGAAGLLVGLALPPLAVAAGAGVFLYFCGAVVFHVRAHDRKGMIAPTALAVTALAATLPAVQNA
ncbi:DoxX family protein [Streptomyces europaeiscabiei]|uniref:DoxX family protein n=1 Tax=Streptomyces europaeiscabiei TaxID=146819 RepID=UPI0029BBBC5E|nr:DoxX family protein [Streptomyces europaeiscabiei]MDX3846878.1 DoxX family protein [Streptomyces europaeiscabiei]